MRNYQRKKNNPYILPHNLYVRTVYIIKDYNRLKSEVEDVIDESPVPSDGQPTARFNKSSVTERKGIRIAEMATEVRAIDKALSAIPEYYRKPVFDNVLYGCKYPLGADVRTYQTYKQRFIYYVAKNLDFVE